MSNGAVQESRMEKTGKLKKSLRLLFVYALATGAILTFIGYWDGVFLGGSGPATFLSFLLMTLLVLPIAFVYCELTPMLPYTGAELVYNTVGTNKTFGFISAWMIMAAWIAVPPAAVMGILDWINYAFNLNWSYWTTVTVGVVVLLVYTILSLSDINLSGQIQTFMLFAALIGVTLTGFIFLFSGDWSIKNFTPFFQSVHNSGASNFIGIKGWIIGTALIVTPYFGFETVPQLVEEGDFPIKDSKKAILGSVITCGALYTFFFFCLAGMGTWQELTHATMDPFVALEIIRNNFGWVGYGFFFGITAVLFTIGTCILGFWISTVRLMFAMGRQNFLPASFAKLNKKQQPIVPNILVLVISIVFLLVSNATTYLAGFYSIMALGCSTAYFMTMYSAIRLAARHPEWERPYVLKGGQPFRVFALIIAGCIVGLCTVGLGRDAWITLAIYLLIGVLLYGWMSISRWPKEKVWMMTPDGEKEY
jgi:APA family basic amino acid/polyamine antiporter